MQEAAFEKKEHKKSKGDLIRRLIAVPIGAFIVAVGLEIFLIPNHVIDGGITGISIMLSVTLGLPIGIFLILLNIPFFLLGYKQIGKTFALTSLLGIALMSLFTQLLVPVRPLTTDPILATVFGGLLVGIGVGLVVRNGGSTDGTEILAILVNKGTPFSVGELVMFINVFILSAAGFVFSWDRAMYSLMAYFIAYKTIDITIEGLEQSKAIWIISEHHEEIGDALNSRLGRGVTYLNGEGAYSGDQKRVIFTVITRLEEAKLKSIVNDIDPGAFLAVGDIHDVKGGNFKKRNIH